MVKFRATLPAWDIEFRAARPRHTPSLALEVVDEATFEHYNTEAPFGVTAEDTNEGLLLSEWDWIDDQLEQALAVEFEADEDYMAPFRNHGSRSRTIVFYSERILAAFSRVVLRIQMVLCQARHDWIIYLQSDGVEPAFIVWVYPEKIQVTARYQDAVRQLLAAPRG